MGRLTGASEVGLLRLVAQQLAGPACPGAAQAVGRLTAVQAQDLRSGLTSVLLRTRERDLAGVDAALAAGDVVRSWPQRGTLHLVAGPDLPWLLELLSPRVLTTTARRRAELGLDDATVERARELAVEALTGGRALRRAALLAHWERAGVTTTGQRGYHLLLHLGITGTLCLGPREGSEQLLVLLADHVGRPRGLERDEALGELALRYFRSHGPATVPDLARWSGLRVSDARAGTALARADLAGLDVDGVEHLLDPRTPELLAEHRAHAEAVHLLPGFDEFVLGYADRSAVLAPGMLERVVPGGNGVFSATVVARGRVVGTWRRTRSGPQVTPFDDDAGLVAAALRRAQELPATW